MGQSSISKVEPRSVATESRIVLLDAGGWGLVPGNAEKIEHTFPRMTENESTAGQ